MDESRRTRSEVIKRFVVIAVSLAGIGCDPGLRVHAEAGSRADSLVLHIFINADSLHPDLGLTGVEVERCANTSAGTDRSVWNIARVGGAREDTPVPVLLRYGQLPAPNWRVLHAAEPLTPGCYIVGVDGAALPTQAKFRIENGAVVASQSTDQSDR